MNTIIKAEMSPANTLVGLPDDILYKILLDRIFENMSGEIIAKEVKIISDVILFNKHLKNRIKRAKTAQGRLLMLILEMYKDNGQTVDPAKLLDCVWKYDIVLGRLFLKRFIIDHSLLIKSIVNGNLNLVKELLLDPGIDLSIKNDKGYNEAVYEAFNSDSDIFKLLLADDKAPLSEYEYNKYLVSTIYDNWNGLFYFLVDHPKTKLEKVLKDAVRAASDPEGIENLLSILDNSKVGVLSFDKSYILIKQAIEDDEKNLVRLLLEHPKISLCRGDKE